jgi:hypothetical protein
MLMQKQTFEFKGRFIEIAVRPHSQEGEWEWGYRIDGGPVREGRPLVGSAHDAMAEAKDTACREIGLILHTAPGDLEGA